MLEGEARLTTAPVSPLSAVVPRCPSMSANALFYKRLRDRPKKHLGATGTPGNTPGQVAECQMSAKAVEPYYCAHGLA
jgi:hypothetical protein